MPKFQEPFDETSLLKGVDEKSGSYARFGITCKPNMPFHLRLDIGFAGSKRRLAYNLTANDSVGNYVIASLDLNYNPDDRISKVYLYGIARSIYMVVKVDEPGKR